MYKANNKKYINNIIIIGKLKYLLSSAKNYRLDCFEIYKLSIILIFV